jgi:uncharacterized protein (TIGR02996 family)
LAVTKDEAALQAQLDKQPDDAASRMVLADLLEDQGQVDAARCQRWLAERRKWADSDLKAFNLTGWHWWSCPDLPNRFREHAVLPEEVQHHMPRGEWLYPSRADAEATLARALAASARAAQ